MISLRSVYALPLVALLTACGSDSSSSGGGGGGGGDPEPDRQVNGVLISPESGDQTTLRLAASGMPEASFQVMVADGDDCSGDIPAGYVRLSDVEITLLDEAGTPLSETLSTDECGIFSGAVPDEAASIRAEPGNGLRPIEADIEVFVSEQGDDDPTVVSTISDSAEYEIRSLFRQSDGRFAFTVADSESGRPVIGIPAARFTLSVAGTDIPLESVVVAAQAQEQAAVSLVLDASGSMSSDVYDDADGNRLTRWHVTRDAAHLFLNEKGVNDLTGVVIFSSSIDLINDEYLQETFTFEDGNGDPASYAFSPSGFTVDADDLRLVVDLYSPYNLIYQSPQYGFNRDPHPRSAPLTVSSWYPWSDSTALYDAVGLGLDRVAEQAPTRKAVVTMGDGGDNDSSLSLQETIDHANALAIPIFSIALGVDENSSGEVALRRLGEETGGDFVSVRDEGAETELLRVFESIQIGIVFQYLATLTDTDQVQPGDTVTLRLEYNSLETEREFTIPVL